MKCFICAEESERLVRADNSRRLTKLAKLTLDGILMQYRNMSKEIVSSVIPPIPVPGQPEKYFIYPKNKAEHLAEVCHAEFSPRDDRCENQEPTLDQPEAEHLCPDLEITEPVGRAALLKLNTSKSSESFLITNRLLKIGEPELAYSLSRLFSLCFKSG